MRTAIIALAGLGLLTAGCGETQGQRAGTGAAGGAIIGGVAGGPIGALVGAGLGAAGGAYREELQQRGDPVVDRQATRLNETVRGAPQTASADVDQQPGSVSTAPPEQQAAAPSADDLTNEEVREAQSALRDMGLYEGDVDGLYGRQTIEAVGEFQERENLPRTRALDDRTRQELESAAAEQPPQREQGAQPPDGQMQEQPPASPSPRMQQQQQQNETAPTAPPPVESR